MEPAHATQFTIVSGSLELGGAALGAHLGGLSGLSLGWLAAVCVVAMLMSRRVYRAARPIEALTCTDQLARYTPYHEGGRTINTHVDEASLG